MPVKRASTLNTMLRYLLKNTQQLLIYRPDGMKQESPQRTPRNSAEEPVKLLSDLVDHILFIVREQACQEDSQPKNSNSVQKSNIKCLETCAI